MSKVTSISAQGFVIADYDTAHFNLSFSVIAPKAKKAKQDLKEGQELIQKTLEQLQNKGLKMGQSTYRVNSSVNPNYVYNRENGINELKGQLATYSVSFQTQNLEMVNEVYDTLSDLDLNQLTVNSPGYSIKAESELKQQALKDAWEVAKGIFTNQCEVLGLKSSDYVVKSWNVDYSGNTSGKARNYTNTMIGSSVEGSSYDESSAIQLNSGRAKVQVTLTADYKKKK